MAKIKTVRHVGYTVQYEYAGFEYQITKTSDRPDWQAVPLLGQHRAANKDKHRRAAIECYLQDYNEV